MIYTLIFAHAFLDDSNADYEDFYPGCNSEYKDIEGIFSALQVLFLLPNDKIRTLTVFKPLRGQVAEKED